MTNTAPSWLVPVERLTRVGPYEHQAPPLPVHWTAPEGMRPIHLHELDLYVTMRCNIRCDFCNVRAGEYTHADLPLDRIASLLEEARKLGLEEVHFLGGEPSLRKDLELMVRHASGLGLHTRIITNGMLLSRQRLAGLIAEGLGEIMISVDGLEATHNRLRQCSPDGWRRTLDCVRHAVDLGLRTRVSAVAYEDNYDEIVPLLRLTDRLGADIFSVFLGSPLGRGRDHPERVIRPARWRALQEAVVREAAGLRPDFEVVMEQGFAWADQAPVDRSAIKGRGTGCNTLLEDFDYLIVRSDGNLYQCVFFMTEGRPIGNILNQPLEATLQYALELAAYRPFTVPQDRCCSCLHQQDCGTGCRGYAYLLSGDWLRTDPRCAKRDPHDPAAPPWYPVCPILKWNVRSGRLGGSTEQALERSSVP
ncbi:MAG: radical SAM protein [Bryobacteraceae bacterium]|nr:radical SAM protein [Bryobacteraceae bacterium]